MNLFIVSGTVTVSIFTEVEANSEKEALEIAESRQMQTFCWQCASRDSDTSWALSDGLDGEPNNIIVEEG